ncbi:MAG: hypothetical protein WCY82_09715 [Desulfotomaculaceae bacterium]
MPMMYGTSGWGILGMLFSMLIPLALLGLVVYWAVNAGVKNAMRKSLPANLDNLNNKPLENEETIMKRNEAKRSGL